MTLDPWRITGQQEIDSYVGRWVDRAVLLVNRLAVTAAHGREVTPPRTGRERLAALAGLLPEGVTASEADAAGLAEVAADLRPVFGTASGTAPGPASGPTSGPTSGTASGDGVGIRAASARLNDLLVRHGAVPHLHDGAERSPVLAFHRPGATLLDAWAADMGTALAMVIGVGQAARLGACQAGRCSLVFFDSTRNASRRFCDLSCQNRAKASAYRARQRS
ncbi:CGNR zinc finger domain-containing protein [Actinomadura sp. ATCC 31491]|uniref:CGNR zinc finger domain-containing protein n=1 Tax=Actinomadura luzonensis TaxID=2805427 RepID=A0ABT0G421_9ACTN|nr:CGNR zinc finger domain-containing protein [Actinomadura luzonensis]MCK2218881.1 CGNR zinc finger domain-containing protein [Actinomadura luzonensis]